MARWVGLGGRTELEKTEPGGEAGTLEEGRGLSRKKRGVYQEAGSVRKSRVY